MDVFEKKIWWVEKNVTTFDTMKQHETLMTTKDVCDYFQISRTTLHRLRKKKKLKTIRIGGNVRFKFSDIEKIIK